MRQYHNLNNVIMLLEIGTEYYNKTDNNRKDINVRGKNNFYTISKRHYFNIQINAIT